MSEIIYWDVHPRSIKVTQSFFEAVVVPLSIRGNPRGTPVFESVQPNVAGVDEFGRVSFGGSVGATMILVYDSDERTSVRYVQVEVVPNNEVPV